jgi:hypothetical protein
VAASTLSGHLVRIRQAEAAGAGGNETLKISFGTRLSSPVGTSARSHRPSKVRSERSCYSQRRRSIRYAKAGRRQGTHLLHKQNSPSANHNRPTFAVRK